MFARQQRRLLSAFGVRMSQPRALALTYSRSAITYAVPAGSAVSAGYAFQEYRSRGASRRTATTVTLLSGLASTLGLFLVYGVGVLVSVMPLVPLGAIGVAAATLLASPVVFHPRVRTIPKQRTSSPPPTSWLGRGWVAVVEAVREAGQVPRGQWYAILALASVNWLADLMCLVAVSRALHLSLSVLTLATAYLAVQVVRQIPLTPGGAGLVETSLLAALVSAGAGHAPAAAVVLGYRFLSCWVIIPVGLVTWFGLRRDGGRSAPAESADPVEEVAADAASPPAPIADPVVVVAGSAVGASGPLTVARARRRRRRAWVCPAGQGGRPSGPPRRSRPPTRRRPPGV
jgi:uncharacterized membrane protein YbhN (UPF0104 family)